MHARELLVGGERRLVARQVRVQRLGGNFFLDRGEALRALGMVRAHFVLQAVRMCDKCNGMA